jgi:hypothetical protein
VAHVPSAKFDANALVCWPAALAMNELRLKGQRGLLGPDAPVRHEAKRRRIKTAVQEPIHQAGCLIEHGRQMVLGLRGQRPGCCGAHTAARAARRYGVAASAGRNRPVSCIQSVPWTTASQAGHTRPGRLELRCLKSLCKQAARNPKAMTRQRRQSMRIT